MTADKNNNACFGKIYHFGRLLVPFYSI